jgi:hypothetical protein
VVSFAQALTGSTRAASNDTWRNTQC